jgi:hypothetical protein
MAFGFEITNGWMLALELGGSAFLAGLLMGVAITVVAGTKVIAAKLPG